MKEKIDRAIKKGELFFLGTKLPEDFYCGFLEWQALAEASQEPKAYYNMGYCSRYGEGIDKDINAAVKCYRAALDGGIERAAEKLYECFGTDPLSKEIKLFDAESSLEEAEQYHKSAVNFLKLLNVLVEKGYTDYRSKIKAAQTVVDVIELHIGFLTDKADFEDSAERLRKKGHEWAVDLMHFMECHLLYVYKYTEEREQHRVVRDGNSSYVPGKKFHTLAIDKYLVNGSKKTCKRYYPKPTEIPENNSLLIHEDKNPWKAAINYDFSQNIQADDVAFIELKEINEELGIATPINLIKPKLPIKYEIKVKALGMRPGNIAMLIGAAALAGMCFYFAVR